MTKIRSITKLYKTILYFFICLFILIFKPFHPAGCTTGRATMQLQSEYGLYGSLLRQLTTTSVHCPVQPALRALGQRGCEPAP